MKTTDFINESFVEDAAAAHQDHEVQMARGDCYNAAKYAIELHKLLKNISEQQGLDGWVSEKITLANDYLRTVTEYLRYEQQSDSSGMDEFNPVSATQTLDAALGESQKPAVVKTNKPIGSRVADIGPGGKEYNVKTDAEWDKQNKQKDVKEGMRGTVSFPDDEGTHTGNNPPVSLGGTFAKRPEVKQGSLVKASGLNGVWRVNDIRGDSANITQEIPNTSKSYSSIPISDLRVWTNKPVKEQGVEEGKADPVGSWVVYDGSKVKRFKSRDGAKAYAEKTGGKVASSEFYADNIQGKKDVDEGLGKSIKRAAQGWGGSQDKPADIVKRNKAHDTDTAKRLRAGIDDAPEHTPQGLQKRVLDRKLKGVAETTSSGSIATSMGGGNGFVNGGPGTIARPRMKKKQ
jgi:hypothetical protein